MILRFFCHLSVYIRNNHYKIFVNQTTNSIFSQIYCYVCSYYDKVHILHIDRYLFCVWSRLYRFYRRNCRTSRRSYCHLCITICRRHSLFNDETAESKVCDAILPHSSFSRELSSSKILKLKLQTAIRLLNASLFHQSERGDTYPDFNHNFIKYSSGYYVYSLEHILIQLSDSTLLY